MNKHCHRLVFNSARGLLMAVAETVTGVGKKKGERAQATTTSLPTSAHTLSAAWRAFILPPSFASYALSSAYSRQLCNGAWVVFGLFSAANSFAQIIADPSAPGNQQATIHQTGNGRPQVDIQTPNAAGVSRNRYQQFDVDAQGAILNNSRTHVQTQLGGYIAGNPHLARGEASVILNEINSPHGSQLRGFIETAGKNAHVIISNPSGITCDGCGFINAHRSTLTTGQINLNNSGNIDHYRVMRGTIHILGKGLNNKNNDYTDILARAIHINAEIWSKKLTAIAGANQIASVQAASHPDYLGEPVVITADANESKPSFAIDIGLLGNMYAGLGRLIGTEDGLGVRHRGTIAMSQGEFKVVSAGIVENKGAITSAGDMTIQAKDGIINGTANASTTDKKAKLTAQGSIHLDTQGNIDHHGIIAAQKAISLIAHGAHSTITSHRGAILAAGIADDGKTPIGQAPLQLSATNKMALHGIHQASGDIVASANTLDLSHSQINAQNIDLVARVDDIDASYATLHAQKRLQTTAVNQLITDYANLFAPDLQLSATHLSNIGGTLTHTGEHDWWLHFLGNINNTDGTISSNNRFFSLSAKQLNNTRGKLIHAGASHLHIKAEQLDSTAGAINTGNTLTLDSTHATLDRANIDASQLTFNAATLSNRGGMIKLTGGGTNPFNVRQYFDNTQGTILSNGALKFELGDLLGISLLNHGGTLSALDNAALDINASGVVDNSAKENIMGGAMTAGGSLLFKAQRIHNAWGTVSAGATLTATSTQDIDNRYGKFVSTQALILTADNINNSNGLIESTQESAWLTARSGTLNNRYGRIMANQTMTLNSLGLDNTAGKMTAHHLHLDSHGQALNNTAGLIQARGMLNINSGALDNSAGKILSNSKLDITSGTLDNINGKIVSGGPLDIKSAALNNQRGLIKTDQTLHIDTQGHTLTNTDSGIDADTAEKEGIISLDKMTLNTAAFNNKNGYIYAKGRLIGHHQHFNNQYGTLASWQDISIHSAGFNNHGGKLASQQHVLLNSSALDNQSGTITALAGLTFNLGRGDLNNDHGTLFSQGTLGIVSGQLNNTQGLIKADQALDINTQGHTLINTDSGEDGGIIGSDSVVLNIGRLHNQGGSIGATKNIMIQTGDLNNRDGTIVSAANMTLNGSALNNQSGTIQAAHNLDMRLGTDVLDNGTLNNAADENGKAGLVLAGGRLWIKAKNLDNRRSKNANQGLRANHLILDIDNIDLVSI